jgi:hypothetical protein
MTPIHRKHLPRERFVITVITKDQNKAHLALQKQQRMSKVRLLSFRVNTNQQIKED